MISANLVQRLPNSDGFSYVAEDAAGAFVRNLATEYHAELQQRARWVVHTFDPLSATDLNERIRSLIEVWRVEFQVTQSLPGSSS